MSTLLLIDLWLFCSLYVLACGCPFEISLGQILPPPSHYRAHATRHQRQHSRRTIPPRHKSNTHIQMSRITVILTVLIDFIEVDGQYTRICQLGHKLETVRISAADAVVSGDRQLRWRHNFAITMVRRRLDGLFHPANNDNLGVTSTFATPGLTDSLSFDSTEDNHKDSPITSTETVAFDGRHCDCADHLTGDKDYYCPEFTDHCQVWTAYNRDYRVSCYNESWKVYYSRYIWYYLVFWFTLLGAALFLSGPGQVCLFVSMFWV